MAGNVYRFVLSEETPLDEAEMTLQLSIFAVEGLYGSAAVRLDAGYFVDEPRRIILVDGTTEVGDAVVRVFTSLLLREIGEDSFQVRRVDSCPASSTEVGAV